MAMTVQEIREQYVPNEDNSPLIEKIKEQGRKYIPILEKGAIADSITSTSLKSENGMIYCDFLNRKLTFEIRVLNAYYNIEFSDDAISDYDFLVSSGIAKELLNEVWDDSDIIDDMVYAETRRKTQNNNSIEGILARGIETVASKLPDTKEMKKLLKDVPKALEKLDPNKAEWVNKIIAFNNGEEMTETEK